MTTQRRLNVNRGTKEFKMALKNKAKLTIKKYTLSEPVMQENIIIVVVHLTILNVKFYQ